MHRLFYLKFTNLHETASINFCNKFLLTRTYVTNGLRLILRCNAALSSEFALNVPYIFRIIVIQMLSCNRLIALAIIISNGKVSNFNQFILINNLSYIFDTKSISIVKICINKLIKWMNYWILLGNYANWSSVKLEERKITGINWWHLTRINDCGD